MVPAVGAWAGFHANDTVDNALASMIGLRHVLHSKWSWTNSIRAGSQQLGQRSVIMSYIGGHAQQRSPT